jgi:hypothetical protein
LEFFQEECAAFTSPMARPGCSEVDCMVWGGQFSSNVDTLSAQAVRGASNEMLLNRKQKDKKEWLEIPRGCDYVFFV